jgi:serine/threonine protein kinase
MKPLTFDQIRFYLYRLLIGLEVMHKANYVHRDIKPENILIDVNHNLALTDFGLAREATGRLSAKSGTQSYRAPEQLFGDVRYGTSVDIWAVGCLMYYLMAGKTLFQGQTDSDQIDEICHILGTPTETEWPKMLQLPKSKIFLPNKRIRRNFRKILVTRFENGPKTVTLEYIDLMMEMLNWNPENRITAKEALKKSLFLGVNLLGEKLPPLRMQEVHQEKKVSRVICDFLIDGLDFEIEMKFPQQCVV